MTETDDQVDVGGISSRSTAVGIRQQVTVVALHGRDPLQKLVVICMLDRRAVLPGACRRVNRRAAGNRRQSTSRHFSPHPGKPVMHQGDFHGGMGNLGEIQGNSVKRPAEFSVASRMAEASNGRREGVGGQEESLLGRAGSSC